MQSPRIDALVLAAGRSLRAGGSNKLLLPWQDKFVVEHAVDAVLLSHVTINLLLSMQWMLYFYLM